MSTFKRRVAVSLFVMLAVIVIGIWYVGPDSIYVSQATDFMAYVTIAIAFAVVVCLFFLPIALLMLFS